MTGVYVPEILQMDSQLLVHTVSITTKVMSSNPAQSEVYSILQYAIKLVTVLRQVVFFSSIEPTPRYN